MPTSSAASGVLAGADCGFGTSANATPMVAPSVVWAKFKSLAEGSGSAFELNPHIRGKLGAESTSPPLLA
jgi:hypothetical protein